MPLVPDFYDRLDLDREVEWEGADVDCGARRPPGWRQGDATEGAGRFIGVMPSQQDRSTYASLTASASDVRGMVGNERPLADESNVKSEVSMARASEIIRARVGLVGLILSLIHI